VVKPAGTAKSEWPARLVRTESVLALRTGKIILVLERCVDRSNAAAIFRTCESLGVQEIWEIASSIEKRKGWKEEGNKKGENAGGGLGAEKWLTLKRFPDTASCIAQLRQMRVQIWATDLGPGSHCLGEDLDERRQPCLKLPDGKVAIVMGREVDGVSQEMLTAADERIYIPMVGFTESFNLSVATALVLQRVFSMASTSGTTLHGDLSIEERNAIRADWYPKLWAKSKTDEGRNRHLVYLESARRGSLPNVLPDLRRPNGGGRVMPKIAKKTETPRDSESQWGRQWYQRRRRQRWGGHCGG